MIAAPMFHSWGFAHFTLGMALGSTIVLRRKFDPEETLSADGDARVHDARRRAGDAPAHPRAAAASRSTATTSRPARHRRQRLRAARRARRRRRWTASATSSTTSTARPRSRGRRSPRRRICAPRRAPPGGRRAARSSSSSTRTGNEVRQGETGRIFVGNEMAFEGYTGGGNKEVIGGLMSSGDVGHFDDGRPPVHRRPRRRDDRLRRRERVPARGRGPARQAQGVDEVAVDRRRRREVRPAPEGVRRAARAAASRARTSSRSTSRRTSPTTRSRARSSSSRSCRATRPARCSSGSWPRTTSSRLAVAGRPVST